MASKATLAAEKAKREAASKAPHVTDPGAMSWEDYRNELARQKGKPLSPTNIKVAKAEWTAAQKATAASSPVNPNSLEAQNAAAAAAAKNPAVIAARNAALQSQGFQVSPGPGGTVNGDQTGAQPTVRDYAKELTSAAKFLYGMKDADRKKIALALKAAGYKVPTNGKYSDQLVTQYQTAIGGNQLRNTQLGLNQSLAEFLITKKGENAGIGTGTASSNYDTTIFNPTQAASYINSEFRQFLNRDATAKEISNLTSQLQAAQKKNPTKVVIDANGNRTQTGGLDAQGYLDSLIKALPEFTTKAAGKAATSLESVLATARANAVTPTQSQINSWTTRIKNGESVDVINHEIRGIASLGQPDSIKKMLASGTDLDTIYSPYKQYMQSILEVPASQITLNDPALRMAIGPDKEMNLYEYQKALRKDPRWQYTQNAKQDVSNSVQKVLQDFGFMG